MSNQLVIPSISRGAFNLLIPAYRDSDRDAQRLSSPGRKQQSEAALLAAPVQITVGRLQQQCPVVYCVRYGSIQYSPD